tara:strand:- start:8275 stop:8484 length:210 start_codon:yes stop_codon:yes gene_type:complete
MIFKVDISYRNQYVIKEGYMALKLDLTTLTELEIEQIENFDATPLEELSEPEEPQWKKDVDLIESLLSN